MSEIRAELFFKLLGLSYSIHSAMAARDNEIIFHDRESYQKVMGDFASHLVNRYGMDEVESWYFDLWKDMDYLRELSKGEIDYLRRAATPKVEMRKLHVSDGVLRIGTRMQAHEIKALDIRYQY